MPLHSKSIPRRHYRGSSPNRTVWVVSEVSRGSAITGTVASPEPPVPMAITHSVEGFCTTREALSYFHCCALLLGSQAAVVICRPASAGASRHSFHGCCALLFVSLRFKAITAYLTPTRPLEWPAGAEPTWVGSMLASRTTGTLRLPGSCRLAVRRRRVCGSVFMPAAQWSVRAGGCTQLCVFVCRLSSVSAGPRGFFHSFDRPSLLTRPLCDVSSVPPVPLTT